MKTVVLLAILSFTICPNGFASRYWDCCKPSCSWIENSGGNPARQCDVNMNSLLDFSAGSLCEGGPATTCIDQIPQVINDNLAYAFAAAPGDGPNVCGKCFELTFTGEGKYETKLNHQKIKGKKLVVIASNIGYDVVGGQFDILIPGGGVGAFNGCDDILGTDIGRRYGGMLSDCEEEVGWSKSEQEIYEERKECLKRKCNTAFSGKDTILKGCLFLADWMEAAGNPLHTYQETSCPDELKANYTP